MPRSFITTNEMQSVSDHSLSGRTEKKLVPRRNRSLVDETISTSGCSLSRSRSRMNFLPRSWLTEGVSDFG